MTTPIHTHTRAGPSGAGTGGIKLPPTGPKAMRSTTTTTTTTSIPFNPPSGPSALKSDRVSISFPSMPLSMSKKIPPSGPSRLNRNLPPSMNMSLESRLGPPPTSTSTSASATSNGQTNSYTGRRHVNGRDTSSQAESSKQALSTSRPSVSLDSVAQSQFSLSSSSSSFSSRDHERGRTTSYGRRSPSSSPPPPPRDRSRSKSKSKSKSPIKIRRPLPPTLSAENAEDEVPSPFLPTTTPEAPRPKISFALPNGIMRPKPPHLDRLPFDKPPPPNVRPPTPPPPEDTLPPPPPSPPARSPSPLPPPPSSLPQSPYPLASGSSRASSPMRKNSRPPSPPREPSVPPPPPPTRPFPDHNVVSSLAPPSFHFRELPLRPTTPSDEGDDGTDASSVKLVPSEPPSVPPSPPPPPPPVMAPRSPSPPPYVAPPYVPPPCAFHRPGIGNYTSHKGKDKEWVKRYDGESDVPVEVVDPRLAIPRDQLERGRGSMKVRTGFYELDYEWDENSTTPKPPPPPTAVLITGLSPLTTTDQISKFLRPYGRIKDIDAKMDTKSGMQLGICWVKFDGPPQGRQGTAHDVALQVVRMCDGQRISLTGDERIKVVLDGRGIRTQKAVKEEMDRRYAPKPKPKAPISTPTPALTPAGATTVSAGTPSSAGGQTPRTDPISAGTPLSKSLPAIPRGVGGPYPGAQRTYRPPSGFSNPSALRNSTFGHSTPSRPLTLPPRPVGLPVRPVTGVQHLESSFTAAPFSHRTHRDDDYDRGRRRMDGPDSYRPGRRRSRSRSVSSYSSYSDYSSDSDARPAYRARTKSPIGDRRRYGQKAPTAPNREDEKATEKIKQALADNGHAYAFIDAKSLPVTAVHEPYLRDHFKAFKPTSILFNHTGWYILFADNVAAYSSQRLLDKTVVQGRRIGLIVKAALSSASKAADESAPPTAINDTKIEKGSWRLLTFTKRNRPIPAPRKPSPKPVAKRRVSFSSSESSEDEGVPLPTRPSRNRLRSVSTVSSLSDEETVPSKSTGPTDDAMDADDAPLTPLPPTHESTPIIVEGVEPEVQEAKESIKGKKRPAKSKIGKAAKKARLASPVMEILPPIEPEVAEIKLDEVEEPEPIAAAKKSTKVATSKKRGPRTDVDKFLTSAGVEDEEDAYWLGQALAAAKDGIEPTFSDDEDVKLDDNHPLYHQSGAWRAEGWKKIPQIQKSTYLPQRNRAAVSEEEASGVTTGRTARLAGRDQHRQTAAVAATNNSTIESDLFAFNQLRIRKKQLRFARSAIEGYGLYAMETIHQGEMVCEYVGEICRASIADVREQKYLKQGIGSSYLFRIDNDMVCDATFKGSVSRLINHSCDPSANAKIIKVNGQSKIVIYAERTLHPGEEILYDYKFPLESDPALRVPCLCAAKTCRGWLN